MQVRSITFVLGRSIPLQPISGDPADQYASVRPSATVTVDLDSAEGNTATEEGRKFIASAFDEAATLCFNEITQFNKDLRQTYVDFAAAKAAKRNNSQGG